VSFSIFTSLEYNRWFQNFCNYHDKNSNEETFFSIIIPLYHPNFTHFKQAIESILKQTYKNWELIIVDDYGYNKVFLQYIKRIQSYSKNIIFLEFIKHKNISSSLNHGVKHSSGDWVLFLDQDDKLNINALNEISIACMSNDNFEMVYCDEDKFDEFGNHIQPNFKFGLNYRLLLAQNYICHSFCVKRSFFNKLGGFSPHHNGSQDWEFCLRALSCLNSNQVKCINKPLYHWRLHANSTSSNINSKLDLVQTASKSLLENFLKTNGIDGSIAFGPGNFYSVKNILIQEKYEVNIFVYGNCFEFEKYRNSLASYSNINKETINKDKYFFEFCKNIKSNKSLNNNYCIFIDSSFFPDSPDWVSLMIQSHQFSFVGFSGPRIMNSCASRVISTGMYKSDSYIKPLYYGAPSTFAGMHYRNLLPSSFSFLHPACLMIKTDLIDEGIYLNTNQIFAEMSRLRNLGYQHTLITDFSVVSMHKVDYNNSTYKFIEKGNNINQCFENLNLKYGDHEIVLV
tara:strand:- start:725 stop:2260 length:1536 start_codon:yes stop_codon:yes gene_type:complete